MDSSSQEMVYSDDLFGRLPDEVVLSIFDKLRDAKSLCLSMCVCKRFRSIAPQVDQIFLPIPIPLMKKKKKKSAAVKEVDQEIHSNSFKNLLMRALIKPFHFISQIIKFKSKNEKNHLDFHVPNQILKSFEEIRALHIKLPCHKCQKPGGLKTSEKSMNFLKWKAEFGRELQSCVILGAKSWSEKDENSLESDQESRVMADDELKLRIVWTISCLIAASARHYFIQDTVKGLKMIENIVASDESDQGRLCMNKQQIEEIRELKGKNGDEMMEQRSRVPALRMKMWYLRRLELPDSGKVMEGATLVVIKPAVGGGEGAEEVEEVTRSDADMVAEAFGEGNLVLGEAVKKLMVAKKCYVLEMNSF